MRFLAIDDERFRRWGIAFALALLACALQWSVRPWVGTKIPFLFFLPAIVATAVWSGRNAGLAVTAMGFASAVRWLVPPGAAWVAGPADELALLIYALLGALLATVGGRLFVSRARVSAAEQRLLLAGEDTGIGIFDVDLATGVVQLSPALALLAGVDAGAPVAVERLVARLSRDVVAESRASLAEQLRARADTYERELRMTSADGTPRWLMLRVHIVWAGERAVRLRGACVDITERKAVDALLRQTQVELSQQVADLHRLHELGGRLLATATLPEQLHMLLSTLAEFHDAGRGLAVLFDAGSGTLALSASIGIAPDALRRLVQLRGIDGGCAVSCASRERRVIADTEAADVDPELRNLAREQGFRAVHSTPLIGQDGEVLGALSIHLDVPRQPTERECTLADLCARKAATIVEREIAQEALADTRGRFQALLDASAVPFVVLAPVREVTSGQVVDFEWSYVNDAAASALHRAPAEFIGKRVLQVLPERWTQSEDASFQHYVAVVDGAETREFEAHVVYQGLDQWFHCVASPLDGSVALWFSDVTPRKRAEQAMHEADRRKDEFLATLAHELRNPLAPIRQASAVSRLPLATEKQKRWAHEVIERQVRHMALLLDDLLDVSRITRGALTLRPAAHALDDLLEAAVETTRPQIEARRHELEIVIPQAPVIMQADPLRLAQVVANLLANAAKYTEPGGRIRLLAALDGDDVVIEVADNGIGIAQESLPAVFEMFTQLRRGDDGEHDRSGGGLGIGLSLTKGLVELHGGSVAVRSEGLGRGSVFTVRLPRGAAPRRAAAAAQDDEARATSARRILVADDNRDAAESLATLLELEGHAVTLAFDGADALVAYERDRPDICLLDIGMPCHSGNEVAMQIRARPAGRAPTLVAITGWGQEHDRHQALAAGFDHHLTKPVDPAQLLRLIAQAPVAPPALVSGSTPTH